MISWQDIYSLDSLLIATTQVYTKCLFQRFKSYVSSYDGNNLYDWARHNKANVIRLHNKLKSKRFHYSPLQKKIVKLPNKVRDIYIARWSDRIVDSMLNTELNRKLDHIQSKNSYAYRLKNAGVDICQRRIAKKLFSYNGPVYIIKRDIKNYYQSINKEILLNFLNQHIENDYLFNLLKQRIYYKAYFNGDLLKDEPGIPFGSALSCFLANLYLSKLDEIIESFPVDYFRYADDILIFSDDKIVVQDVSNVLEEETSKLCLQFKDSHKKDMCFNTEDINFKTVIAFKHLGLYFKKEKLIGIAREKIRKILNIFKRAIKRRKGTIARLKTPQGKAKTIIRIFNDIIENNIRPVAIIDYYLKHMTDMRQLKELDRMIAELILATATGRGYRKSNYKIISFKQLREWGLPSLQYRRNLLQHGHLKSNFFDFRARKLKTRSPKSLNRLEK